MLTELSIKNFAIINEISITFNEGMTVLTGETGAGKSILIDALHLLAGGRGSVEYVRHGTKKAQIEGLFTIDEKRHAIYQVGKQYGIDIQDAMIVLHRTITENGKSICRINGKLVTLAILREFGKTLIDIHSQHETQTLMNPETHIELLDLYDNNILKSKEEYTHLYEKYRVLKKRYKDLSENEQESAHRLDLLEFQMTELEEANLVPYEDEQLEKERSYLTNFEKIFLAVQNAYNSLYGEQKGIEWLNQAQLSLQENREFDTFLAEKADVLTDHYFQIEELSYELRDFQESLHYDANRLNGVESRLHEIDRLKKKYGTSVNEMLEYMSKIEEEIDQLNNKDSHLKTIMKQINEVASDAWLEAKQLHDLRKKAAKNLEKEIHEELKGLYLDHAIFSITFGCEGNQEIDIEKKKSMLQRNGFDQISFLISTNPGEPLKELQKIVSGGELSRIMLVIKKIFAKHEGVTSVIFDEVDTGVSGRVAQGMAEKIYQISNAAQVLCITHLPQVAAMADTHKLILKNEEDGRTSTSVKELTRKEMVEELSRMMTGTKLTESALKHGEKLFDLATKFKSKNSIIK